MHECHRRLIFFFAPLEGPALSAGCSEARAFHSLLSPSVWSIAWLAEVAFYFIVTGGDLFHTAVLIVINERSSTGKSSRDDHSDALVVLTGEHGYSAFEQ